VIRLLLTLLLLMSTPARAAYLCDTWRGQVYALQPDGSYTVQGNEVLYTFDVGGPEESWTFGEFGGNQADAQTVYSWSMAVAWFGLFDDAPAGCQFTLGYMADQVFSDAFESGGVGP
jgi:hypothetical protein